MHMLGNIHALLESLADKGHDPTTTKEGGSKLGGVLMQTATHRRLDQLLIYIH